MFGKQRHINRNGLRIRNDAGLHPEVKRACTEFACWLRKEEKFPIRITVYIKNVSHIKALDGEMVSATCFLPFSKSEEPYAKVSAGDFESEMKKIGKDNALAEILHSVAHELTHYFCWINDDDMTDDEEECYAKEYADWLLDSYAMTREHP